jgi:hypothetical protein
LGITDVLKDVLESWSALYSNHAALRTAIEFLHIGGTAAGGGSAVVVDLATIAAARESAAIRPALLLVLKRTHTIIVLGLAAILVSGVLLFAADVDSFLYSRIFWLKMGLMVLLLINGTVILRVERQAIRGDEGAWSRLNLTATASLVFWSLTALAGTALPNIG